MPTWKVEFDDRARRDLYKFDRAAQSRILKFLRTQVAVDADPPRIGRALSGPLKGLWRYRVGDYRLACQIEDHTITVLAVAVGHRSVVYR